MSCAVMLWGEADIVIGVDSAYDDGDLGSTTQGKFICRDDMTIAVVGDLSVLGLLHAAFRGMDRHQDPDWDETDALSVLDELAVRVDMLAEDRRLPADRPFSALIAAPAGPFMLSGPFPTYVLPEGGIAVPRLFARASGSGSGAHAALGALLATPPGTPLYDAVEASLAAASKVVPAVREPFRVSVIARNLQKAGTGRKL